jgi:hypothetical protein
MGEKATTEKAIEQLFVKQAVKNLDSRLVG